MSRQPSRLLNQTQQRLFYVYFYKIKNTIYTLDKISVSLKLSNIDGAINFDDLKHLLWQRYEHCNVWNEVWHDVHETVAKYRQITGMEMARNPINV